MMCFHVLKKFSSRIKFFTIHRVSEVKVNVVEVSCGQCADRCPDQNFAVGLSRRSHNTNVSCRPAELCEQALKYEKGSYITSTGALATLSGAKTGRSPKDKRVVKEDTSRNDLWWGK
jgi:ATP-dependent phosphoenolpyruvate carboxykinase